MKKYIRNFRFEKTKNNQGNIKIALKYNNNTNMPAIKKLIRISKPGLRKYADAKNLPRVINGLGIAIISTSKGVVTDKEARSSNIGGEVLSYLLNFKNYVKNRNSPVEIKEGNVTINENIVTAKGNFGDVMCLTPKFQKLKIMPYYYQEVLMIKI